jgi:hypothetical protein
MRSRKKAWAVYGTAKLAETEKEGETGEEQSQGHDHNFL